MQGTEVNEDLVYDRQEWLKTEENRVEKMETEINELEKYITQCTESNHLLDAESSIHRLELMKQELQKKRINNLKVQHQLEVDKLESLMKQEIESFEQNCVEKISEFNLKINEFEEQLRQKHEGEIESLKKKFETYNFKHKFSKLHIDLNNQRVQLIKLKKFKEADTVTKKIAVVEKEENEKFEKEKNSIIESKLKHLKNKHQNELNILNDKIRIELDKLNSKSESDKER